MGAALPTLPTIYHHRHPPTSKRQRGGIPDHKPGEPQSPPVVGRDSKWHTRTVSPPIDPIRRASRQGTTEVIVLAGILDVFPCYRLSYTCTHGWPSRDPNRITLKDRLRQHINATTGWSGMSYPTNPLMLKPLLNSFQLLEPSSCGVR